MKKMMSLALVLLFLLPAAGCGDQTPDETDFPDDTETESVPVPNDTISPAEREPLPFPNAGEPEDVCALPSSAYAPAYEDIIGEVESILSLRDGVTLEDGGSMDLPEGTFAVVKMLIGGEHMVSFYVADDHRIYALSNAGEMLSLRHPDLSPAYVEQYNAAMDMMSGGTLGWNVDFDLTYQPDETMDPYCASNYLQFSTSEEFDTYLHHIFTEDGIRQVLAGTRYIDHDGRLYLQGGNRGFSAEYAFHCFGSPVIWDDRSITFSLYSYTYETDDNGTATGLCISEFISENACYVLRETGGVWLVDQLSMPY